MGRIRIVMLAFGIAASTLMVASQEEVVYADQLVGVTKATNLIGKQVTNLEGKDLGEIKDLVINWRSGGYIEYAVLSFGGFLGLGDKYFAVRVEGFSDEQRQGAFHPECEGRATEKCAGVRQR